jgi:hypothetical protein
LENDAMNYFDKNVGAVQTGRASSQKFHSGSVIGATARALAVRSGWSPVWAATSAGAIARLAVLPGIESITVFEPAPGSNQGAARRAGIDQAVSAHWRRHAHAPRQQTGRVSLALAWTSGSKTERKFPTRRRDDGE